MTAKGATLLTCSRWPKCGVSGTPALMAQFAKKLVPMAQPEPVRLGSVIVQVAQMRIHQSKLRTAKTAAEREVIRKSALEALK